jgi:uncharacterized membrane protein
MAKQSESKLFAFLGVFLTLIGWLIVMLTRKNDKYAMFYAKQGLMLFIAWVIVAIAGSIIPVIGWFIIMPFGNILMFILWVIAIVNSFSGKMKATPIIGGFASRF